MMMADDASSPMIGRWLCDIGRRTTDGRTPNIIDIFEVHYAKGPKGQIWRRLFESYPQGGGCQLFCMKLFSSSSVDQKKYVGMKVETESFPKNQKLSPKSIGAPKYSLRGAGTTCFHRISLYKLSSIYKGKSYENTLSPHPGGCILELRWTLDLIFGFLESSRSLLSSLHIFFDQQSSKRKVSYKIIDNPPPEGSFQITVFIFAL